MKKNPAHAKVKPGNGRSDIKSIQFTPDMEFLMRAVSSTLSLPAKSDSIIQNPPSRSFEEKIAAKKKDLMESLKTEGEILLVNDETHERRAKFLDHFFEKLRANSQSVYVKILITIQPGTAMIVT